MIVFPVRRADARVSEHYRSPAEAKRTGLRVHGGLDVAPLPGRTLDFHAPESGRIVIADHTVGDGDASGRDVMVLADSGRRWWGGHLAQLYDVQLGARVLAGRKLARVGSTGNSSGVHLHLELHWPSINVEWDPWPFLHDAPDPDGKTKAAAPAAPTPIREADPHMRVIMNPAGTWVWLRGSAWTPLGPGDGETALYVCGQSQPIPLSQADFDRVARLYGVR